MAWLAQFLLGRPGQEYSFEINPEGMQIQEGGLSVIQRNLSGDLKKSTLKVSVPTIKINSSFLSLAQRNQFVSLVGVSDTFLSFQTRDDWQQVNDYATVIDTLHLQLQNSSALRLSKVLVAAGYPSIITINTVSVNLSQDYGIGGFGGGGYGVGDFDPGAISYNDATYIITMSNPIPDVSNLIYVTYTYTGWLVNLENLGHAAQGGWVDRFTYDFQLTGA